MLAAAGLVHTFSLARYRVHHATVNAIVQYAYGRCLDAGSGLSPYRAHLQQAAGTVISTDWQQRDDDVPVDVLCDVQDLQPLQSESFDTILCTQVLEHVPRPWDAFKAFSRVIRPGGYLILTVPHLSAIHEAPHDYYRYTKYGLTALAESNGFSVISVKPTAGLLAFLGHSSSWLLHSIFGIVPVVRQVAWLFNYVFFVRTLGLFDRVLGIESVYPCDYILIAKKVDSREKSKV